MLSMINLEMEQIEDIQKELNQGAIDLNDIENRFVSFLKVKCIIHSGNLKLSGKQITSVTSVVRKFSKNFTALPKTSF